MGLLWLIFLYWDIRRHQRIMRKERSRIENSVWLTEPKPSDIHQVQSCGKCEGFCEVHKHGASATHHTTSILNPQSPHMRSASPPTTDEMDMDDGISHISIPVSSRRSFYSSKIYKDGSYTFCKSRHSGSFYLKIGAAGESIKFGSKLSHLSNSSSNV